MKRIDTHAHVFVKDMQFIANARYTPSYDAPVADYIKKLNAHEIDYGLLIQPSFLGFDNTFMLDAIAQYPERLKGVAVVPMDATLNHLQQMKEKGIIGVRLNLFGVELPDLTTSEAKNFLDHLVQLKWHLEIHCPPSYLVKLLPQLNRFDVQVVIDHFGRIDPNKGFDDPDYQEVLGLVDPKKHWIKVSGYYRLGQRPSSINNAILSYQALKARGMLKRLVWGSDWPNTQHESEESYQGNLDAFGQIVTDPQEQQLILADNAMQLWRFAEGL